MSINCTKLIYRFFQVTLMMWLGVACVFQEQIGDTAICNSGESFNAVERRCEAIIHAPQFPVATLSKVVFPEDSGVQYIELKYTDRNNDPALACEIMDYDEEIDGDLSHPPTCACNNGKCFASILADKNFHGLSEFKYRIRDKDGRSDIKMVGVEVTATEDAPVADMNGMDEKFLYALIENLDARDNHFVMNYTPQATNASILEGSSKTIYLWGSDPDGDVVSDCDIVSHSPYLRMTSECYCESDLYLNGSICNVEVLSVGNYSGPGEYITYQVFANQKWSNEETHFIEILPVDDPPLICHYAKATEKSECTMGADKTCRSRDLPNDSVIKNHTNSRPVMYLDETNGECYRSVKKEDGTYRWIGSLKNRGEFLNGLVQDGSMARVEYPYGAEWISVNEDSEVNFFKVQAAFDVDSPENPLKYYVEDNTYRGVLKSCLSNNIQGVDTAFGSTDLECQYDLKNSISSWAKNLNDDYLTDTTTINNVAHSGSAGATYPTLRFRAKQSGDLSKTPGGRVCVSLTNGATNGGAIVSVDSFFMDSIEKDYCHDGFSKTEAKNECGIDHVSYLQFHPEYPVFDGHEFSIDLADSEIAPFKFHHCNREQVEDPHEDGNVTPPPSDWCECNDRQTDPMADDFCPQNADGTFHIHFDEDQSDEEIILTTAENTLFAINRIDGLQARADEWNPAKIWIKHEGVSPSTVERHFLISENRDLDRFSGADDEDDWILSQESFTPYWQYDCGDNKGGKGRHITVKIEDGVTTSQKIKEAIDAHSMASALVDVHLYASRKETVTPTGLYNEITKEGLYAWPRVLGGGRDYADHMTYYAVDQVTGERSNLGRVYFSIASINDHPYLPNNPVPISETPAYEDTIYQFELTPAQDPDLAESLSYWITDDVIDGGVLSNCANLPGSDGPADLTCTFTPNEHYTGEILFHYQAKDHDGALSEEREVSFEVIGDNDNPTLCQFSTFQAAQECGIEDCIGVMSPVGVITPASHTSELPIYYYQEGEGVCWKSTGNASAGSWEIAVNGNIFDININQSEEIIIKNIRFDEGGGSFEDTQELVVKNITSSNTDIVPLDNIQILINGVYEPLGNNNHALVVNLNDGASDGDSADLINYYLKIIPIVGNDGIVNSQNRGQSTITITLEDQNTSDENSSDITVTFNVNVNPIDINHNGWSKVQALGPKIAGTAYCEREGVREITSIDLSNEDIDPTTAGIELNTLEDGSTISFSFPTAGTAENKARTLSEQIDASPYFKSTSVGPIVYITNINYGDANHTINCNGGGNTDCFSTVTEGVEKTSSNTLLTKSECEDNFGIWRDGEEILDSPYVCSFSEDKCNDGKKCRGVGSPDSVFPDQFNAIYRDDNSGACWRARAKYELGNLTLKSKLEGAIVVNVTHDGVKGHEEVIVGTQYGVSNGDETCLPGNNTFFRSGAFAAHVIHFKISAQSDDDDLYERLVGDGDMDCEDGDASCLVEVTLNQSGSTSLISKGQYVFAPFDVYYAKIEDIMVLTKKPNQTIKFVDNNISIVDPALDSYDYLQLEENLTVFQRVKYDNNVLRVSMNHLGTLACDLTKSINEKDDDESDRIIKGKGRNDFVAINLAFNSPSQKVSSGTANQMIKVSSAHYWESLMTYCNISQSKKAYSCSDDMYLGASCIGEFSPNIDAATTSDLGYKDSRLAGNIIPRDFNEFFFDQKNKTCYRSDVVDPEKNGYRFSPYVATGSTTLGWEKFNISTNDVITGYNVYRKLGMVNRSTLFDEDFSGEDGANILDQPISFDFDRDEPINIFPIAANASEWTDNFKTSRLPPVPGTVYFYEVRPIIKNVSGRSPEPFSVIRVLSPPKNMSLVHRWMANKKMCEIMHANERTDQENPEDFRIDKDNNFTCPYTSFGNENTTYDIGKDYLVMQVEAGCPYTKNGCSGNNYDDGDCLGDVEPNNTIKPEKAGMVYYSRSSGICYRAKSVNIHDWQQFNVITDFESTHSLMNYHLPPLTNLTQNKAKNVCLNAKVELNTNALGIVNLEADKTLGKSSRGKDRFFSQVDGEIFPGFGNVDVQEMTLPSRLLQMPWHLRRSK